MTMPAHTPLPAVDRRSDEILERIRGTFAEKGFDGASMQDLARAAGISVGNFYRYFPSKAAIVEAIVSRELDRIEQDFAVIQGSTAPLRELRDMLGARIGADHCGEDGPIWAEITAAALRKPEIAVIANRMESEIVRYMTTIFANVTGLDPAQARHRFGAHATLIVMLVKASSMQTAMPGARDAALDGLVLQTIDGLLAEISHTARKE